MNDITSKAVECAKPLATASNSERQSLQLPKGVVPKTADTPWFIFRYRVFSKQLRKRLDYAIEALRSVSNESIEIYWPTVSCVITRGERKEKVTVERVIFPGMMFVHAGKAIVRKLAQMADMVLWSHRRVDGTVDYPKLRDSDIQLIRSIVDEEGRRQSFFNRLADISTIDLRTNDIVRINVGSLKGHYGCLKTQQGTKDCWVVIPLILDTTGTAEYDDVTTDEGGLKFFSDRNFNPKMWKKAMDNSLLAELSYRLSDLSFIAFAPESRHDKTLMCRYHEKIFPILAQLAEDKSLTEKQETILLEYLDRYSTIRNLRPRAQLRHNIILYCIHTVLGLASHREALASQLSAAGIMTIIALKSQQSTPTWIAAKYIDAVSQVDKFYLSRDIADSEPTTRSRSEA